MRSQDAECLDFYFYGMKEEVLGRAGFVSKDEKDGPRIISRRFKRRTVISISPKYFQQRRSDSDEVDCDQDRPNLVPSA